MTSIYNLGAIYLLIFVLLNVVILLNFVIAILSSTFPTYEEQSLGLYNNVLNEMFALNEWDDSFGALIACHLPNPMNVVSISSFPVLLLFGFDSTI